VSRPDYFDSPRFVELVYLREVVRARWQESERVPVSSVLNLIDAMPDCGETFYTQASVDQAFNRGFFKGRDTLQANGTDLSVYREVMRSYREGVYHASPDDKPDVLEAIDFLIDQFERVASKSTALGTLRFCRACDGSDDRCAVCGGDA
jgi:hypothetical protein